ncbi:MAG: hypothetical protein AAGD07_09460 [Planctomycetota bacterium]
MPSYWPNGVAIRKDIPGSPQEQIEAIWQYLLEGRQARAPAGVIREPLEIVVTNEARMLRRRYPEIGKRGIGVGYPGGVNLGYDALQMRLAMIWRGPFVDPAAAWYGQGSGNVRPLGPTLLFPKGPELTEDETKALNDSNRPSSHQFQGYSLDQQRRPTMRYQFESVIVTDTFREFSDDLTGQTQLRRRVTLESPESLDGIRFRLAFGDRIESIGDARFRINNRLNIRVLTDQEAVTTADNMLELPLTLTPQRSESIVVEYRWD